MKTTMIPSSCLCTVCVWASLPEGVEPQSLHWPSVRHSLWPPALRVLLQLSAGSSPQGQSYIQPQLTHTWWNLFALTLTKFDICIFFCRWIKLGFSAVDRRAWPRTWRNLARKWTRGIKPILYITMRISELSSAQLLEKRWVTLTWRIIVSSRLWKKTINKKNTHTITAYAGSKCLYINYMCFCM